MNDIHGPWTITAPGIALASRMRILIESVPDDGPLAPRFPTLLATSPLPTKSIDSDVAASPGP